MGIVELEVEVSCYSGHTYAERPGSFVWQGITYRVAEIMKDWQQPGERCFRVVTQEGDCLIFAIMRPNIGDC